MKISVIYAQDKSGAIGFAGPEPLPWHFSEDLKRFKELTAGKPIIMGSHTFESLPRLLPGRFHYVVTRKKGLARLGRLDSVQFMPSVGLAVEDCREVCEDEVFIIGGAEIIRRGLDMADTVYRTIVDVPALTGAAVVKVAQPGEDAVWDEFERVSEVKLDDVGLIFETWVRK